MLLRIPFFWWRQEGQGKVGVICISLFLQSHSSFIYFLIEYASSNTNEARSRSTPQTTLVRIVFLFFCFGHWELPCAPRPTASHDVPPRSACKACPCRCAPLISSWVCRLSYTKTSAGSLLLDSYPEKEKRTVLKQRCCRIAKTERDFLAVSDGYTKDFRRLSFDLSLGGWQQRGGLSGSARTLVEKERGARSLRDCQRWSGRLFSFWRECVACAGNAGASRGIPLGVCPSLPLFSRTLPPTWNTKDIVTALSDCAWTNVRRRRTPPRSRRPNPHNSPAPPPTTTRMRVDNAASRFWKTLTRTVSLVDVRVHALHTGVRSPRYTLPSPLSLLT